MCIQEGASPLANIILTIGMPSDFASLCDSVVKIVGGIQFLPFGSFFYCPEIIWLLNWLMHCYRNGGCNMVLI